jgi:phosphate butyryltransferase
MRNLDDIFDKIKERETKKRLVVVFGNDDHTIKAVGKAIDMGIVEGILVGDKPVILKVCDDAGIEPEKFRIVNEPDELKAGYKSVQMILQGEGDLLMKGMISTDKYMRVILNKEDGLMTPGAILCHVSVLKPENYHKLLVIGDVAIIPAPELKEKIAITKSLIHMSKVLGVQKPKLAVLAATEQVLPKMQACTDAAVLSKMGERGQIKGAIIDGPLALDVIVDKESAKIKNLNSPVAGDADCILFPNIEAGNVFYKFHTKLTGGELGAIVAGAKVPAILSSRGDTPKTKLYSIALAALFA